MKPLCAILEGTVEDGCAPEEVAELGANSDEIGAALKVLGYDVEVVSLTLDTDAARNQLIKLKPAVVFNLVDSVEGKGDLATFAPLLLEHLGLAFTGASSIATVTSSHKIAAKQILKSAGLPTPAWLTEPDIAARTAVLDRAFIVKSVTEHASFGLFADSVVRDEANLYRRWRENQQDYWGEWFAEEFIDGREFNIGVIAGESGPRVMPPAEITFTSDFPKDAPRIIDYTAKWQTDTPEYKGTVRRLDFPDTDRALLKTLHDLVVASWNAFSMNGYARVDFRVDIKGNPYILEVNANPFLTAKEGLGAAAAKAGIDFTNLVRHITDDALRRHKKTSPKPVDRSLGEGGSEAA